MNIYLSEGQRDQIPGDMILRCVLRSDLAPVPRTLEMTVQLRNGIEEKLTEGKHLWGGYELLKYRIVKSVRERPAGVVQGKSEIVALTVTALLDSCAEISFRRARAVVAENQSLGALYRMCGAKIAIAGDFPVRRFVCFAGQVPSFHIATALQDESAALVLRDKQVSVVRLHELFKQQPKDVVGQVDATDAVTSEYLQRHEIPAFFSLDDAGGFVMGDMSRPRAIRFQPRTPELPLRNLSRVPVTENIMHSQMSQQIAAGDLLDVTGNKLVVITAAHQFLQREGITETTTKLWLGRVSA